MGSSPLRSLLSLVPLVPRRRRSVGLLKLGVATLLRNVLMSAQQSWLGCMFRLRYRWKPVVLVVKPLR